MARVNISLPDDLERDSKLCALHGYLAELDTELGPPTAEELAAAEAADQAPSAGGVGGGRRFTDQRRERVTVRS